MTVNEWTSKVIADPTLTPEALRLLLYVVSLGPGDHEVAIHTMKSLLRCRSEKVVYDAREVASNHGLGWRRGGRGHGTVYFWLLPQGESSNVWLPPQGESSKRDSAPDFDSPSGGNQKFDSPSGGNQKTLDSPPGGNQKFDSPSSGNQKFDSPPGGNQTVWFLSGGESNAPVVVDDVDVEQLQIPPLLSPPLSNDAEKLAVEHTAILGRALKPLRDYVSAKLKPGYQQRAYIASVVGFLKGDDPTVWVNPESGERAPREDWQRILATALNELGTVDEQKYRKHPPGDVQNLRNKIEAKLKQEGRKNGKRAGARATQAAGDPGGPRAEVASEAPAVAKLGSNHGAHQHEE